MRAAVLAELKQPFVVEEIELLDPTPGRVVVRTGATPFCSTDCINQRGELGKVPPTILGHASIGVVEAIGADVTHVAVGDRVLVPGHARVRPLLLLRRGPARPVLGALRRQELLPRRLPPGRRAGQRGGQRRRLRRDDERHRQPGLPAAHRPARRRALAAGLRDHLGRRARCFNVAEVKPGPVGRDPRLRAPRAVDDPGRAAGRGRADHRGRADRRAARDGGPARAPPTSSTPPTATRSSRCARSPAGAAPTTCSRPPG